MKRKQASVPLQISAGEARRMVTHYIADMAAALRHLSKTYQVEALEKLFESAYYLACMEASGLSIPVEEMEFLKQLQTAGRKYK